MSNNKEGRIGGFYHGHVMVYCGRMHFGCMMEGGGGGGRVIICDMGLIIVMIFIYLLISHIIFYDHVQNI